MNKIVKSYFAPRILSVFLLSSTRLLVHAQFYNLPADYSFSLRVGEKLAQKDSAIHSSIQPYIVFFSPKYEADIDSTQILPFLKENKIKNLVFYSHLLKVKSKEEQFKLHIDPILNFEGGYDLLDSSKTRLYSNTRGIIANGSIGKRFYFETMLVENQSVLPAYISDAAITSSVIPGQGRWKPYKTSGYDYAFSSGFISIQANKYVNIQLGHGKHKIGNGYRSLLLSDNAFNYPYARFTFQLFKGKVQYTTIYSVFMNLVSASKVVNPNTERLFQKKAASFQYLSINATRFLNLSFFQGLIWQAADERNKQHLEWQYFNPIIYTNLFSYGLDDKNNILLGADMNLKFTNKISAYGQLMLDHLQTTLASSGCGMQAGMRFFEVFGIKNLYFQTEYNQVQRGSYHNPPNALSDQSYTHYQQNIAYTPVNGKEIVFMSDYRFRRSFINVKYHKQYKKGDIPGETYNLDLINAKVGYIINPSYNLNISVGVIYRSQKFDNFSPAINETNYIYVGLKTSLYNLYYDF